MNYVKAVMFHQPQFITLKCLKTFHISRLLLCIENLEI